MQKFLLIFIISLAHLAFCPWRSGYQRPAQYEPVLTYSINSKYSKPVKSIQSIELIQISIQCALTNIISSCIHRIVFIHLPCQITELRRQYSIQQHTYSSESEVSTVDLLSVLLPLLLRILPHIQQIRLLLMHMDIANKGDVLQQYIYFFVSSFFLSVLTFFCIKNSKLMCSNNFYFFLSVLSFFCIKISIHTICGI